MAAVLPVRKGVLSESKADKFRKQGAGASRAQSSYPSGGMMVLFHPDTQKATILVCPGNPELEGRDMGIGGTASYMERAQKFAQSKSTAQKPVDPQGPLEQMLMSAKSARLRIKEENPSPDMFFYLPQAWQDSRDANLLRVNMTPISCSCPEHENAKSPIQGHLFAYVDLIGFRRDALQTSNGGCDKVTYIFSEREAPVHAGSLSDPGMVESIEKELGKPLYTTKGSRGFKYCVALPGTGNVQVFSDVATGWNRETSARMASAGEYVEHMIATVTDRLASGGNVSRREEIEEWVRTKAQFRLQAGEVNAEFFDDKSGNANDSNRRFLVDINESCLTLNPYPSAGADAMIVRQPLGVVRVNGESEFRRHSFTFRCLAVGGENLVGPGGRAIPVSSGPAMIQLRSSRKNVYGSLAAVLTPADPEKLESRFSLRDGGNQISFMNRPELVYDLALALAVTEDPAARVELIEAAAEADQAAGVKPSSEEAPAPEAAAETAPEAPAESAASEETETADEVHDDAYAAGNMDEVPF